MANSKFDFSLLKPLDTPKSSFEANLVPLDDDESIEDASAYLDNLPKPPSALSAIPRDILIGLAHAGRNLHNLPHDLVAGIEGGTQDFGNTLESLLPIPNVQKSAPLSSHLPYDTNDYSDVFGQVGAPSLMDSLIQKTIEHGPELAGLGRLGLSVLRRYPIGQTMAARQLKQAQGLVDERNVGKIPLSSELIDEAVDFLPKTYASRELLKKALEGNYKEGFSLQSQIGKHERDLRKSPLAAERLLAPQARELKETILQQMEDSLRVQGHDDIADLLRGGLNDYRKYIHFRENVKPIIKKLGIPTSVLALLGFGTNTGRKLKSQLGY